MGGLIARYAIGLLASPDTGTVAGLMPVCFVSIATPHLGCSSHHPNEVTWQGSPYMRWLAAGLRSGHLGGLQHMMQAADTEYTAAAIVLDGEEGPAKQYSSSSGHNSISSKNHKSWALAAFSCRSVVQLMGCDVWWGPPKQHMLQFNASCNSTTAAMHGCCTCAANDHSSVAHGGTTASISAANAGATDTRNRQAAADSNVSSCALLASCKCSYGSWKISANCNACGNSHSDGSNPSSGDSNVNCNSGAMPLPLLDYMVQDVELQCTCCGANHCCCFLTGLGLFEHRATYSTAGGDHLIPWSSSSLLFPEELPAKCGSVAVLPSPALLAWHPHIVEHPARNMQQQQQQQGKQQQRAASSYGGAAEDQQLQQAGQQQPQQPEQPEHCMQQHEGQLNGLPQQQQHEQHEQAAVRTRLSGKGQQWQQRQQEERWQQQTHMPHLCKGPDETPWKSCAISKAAAAAAAPGDAPDSNAATAIGASAHLTATGTKGVLARRLLQLQSVGSWRRYHVVWPRLCLGSAHCNIQYNGPMNFVGRAVVEHLVKMLTAENHKQ
eukprot:GHRR01013953.1.p1 GENE.GHRR01013953.1~~GHRR01013953.1.p1  ORF type:complete len:551 (+),score=223.72 GHRR01013953.1:242-1894(+)